MYIQTIRTVLTETGVTQSLWPVRGVHLAMQIECYGMQSAGTANTDLVRLGTAEGDAAVSGTASGVLPLVVPASDGARPFSMAFSGPIDLADLLISGTAGDAVVVVYTYR